MNCYEFKMCDFLDCLIDGNLKSLNGDANLWQAILSEFSELRTCGAPNPALELQKEIAVLDKKVELIDLCVSVLWEVYNRNLANELQQMGFKISLDWSNKVKYYKELTGVISKAKKYIIASKTKSKELDQLLKTNEGLKPRRQDFIKINIEDLSDNISEIRDCIKKYYPIGLKRGDEKYSSYSGIKELNQIIQKNIVDDEYYKKEWDVGFIEKLKTKLNFQDIRGTTAGCVPNFSGAVLLKNPIAI